MVNKVAVLVNTNYRDIPCAIADDLYNRVTATLMTTSVNVFPPR